MKIELVKIYLPIITAILLVGLSTYTVLADTGNPASINASYDSVTKNLTTSGNYNFSTCPAKNKAVGFATFIGGANPTNPGIGALDGKDVINTMHPANMVNYVFPCVATGTWGPISHTVDSLPTQVCVVIYDVHSDKLPSATGNHSTVGAGTNHNTDNSFENSKDSYPSGSCVTPTVVPSPSVSPSPSPSASPTPTPTPSVSPSPSPTPTPTPSPSLSPSPTTTPSPTPNGCEQGSSCNTGDPSPTPSPTASPTPEATASASTSTGGLNSSDGGSGNNSNSNNNSSGGGAVLGSSTGPQVLASTGISDLYIISMIGFGMITAGLWQLKRSLRLSRAQG